MNTKHKFSKGIGLIEVLVATVVISLGLLSIASMQGNFLSESGANKAKAEAQILAEQKIEEYRNVSTKDAFTAYASGTDATITGKNASFTRSWVIADFNAPVRKSIDVKVSWGDQEISLKSELAWNAVGNSSIYSSTNGNSGMGSALPSPSSDAGKVEAMDADELAANDDGTIGDGYGFKRYRNADGKDIVADEDYGLVCDENENCGYTGRQLTCDHVCLSVTGSIYLPADATSSYFDTYEKIRDDDVTVCRWEENKGAVITYAVDASGDKIPPSTNEQAFEKRNYICYFSGDCSSETDDTYAAAGCPSDYADLPTPNVTGGWRGNIGLIGFDETGTNTLCFQGQEAGTTRRNYRTTRLNGDGTAGVAEEGVNTNYACHNFLMMKRIGGQNSCADHADIRISGANINRTLTGTEPNRILTDSSSCTDITHSFTGDVVVSAEDNYRQRSSLRILVSSEITGVSGSCFVGPVDANGNDNAYATYTCEISLPTDVYGNIVPLDNTVNVTFNDVLEGINIKAISSIAGVSATFGDSPSTIALNDTTKIGGADPLASGPEISFTTP